MLRRQRRPVALVVVALVAVLLLAVSYAGLAVYKAYDYTTTPRENTSGIVAPADGLTFQDVSFLSAANDGVTLSGWWVPNPSSHRVLILVHGRYANRMQMLPLVKPLWDDGFNVLLFDLRAHGLSTYTESTYGIKEQWDVIAAARFVRQQGFSPSSIGVMGWSLGGASTLMAMGNSDDFTAAVTDSAYANADRLLARNPLRPGLALSLKWFRGVNLSRVSPVNSIRHLSGRSIMLIQGSKDVVVPPSQERLLQSAGGSSVQQVWIVPDAGHVGSFAAHPNEYVQKVSAFFDVTLR